MAKGEKMKCKYCGKELEIKKDVGQWVCKECKRCGGYYMEA